MKVFRSIDELSRDSRPSVVTIGNFDGVHRGHQMVLAAVIARARELNARSVAVTFDPHPARLLHPEVDVHLITPLDRKLDLLASCGLDATLVLPFTEAFSHWSAYDFAARILRDALRAVEVHEGETFRFGYHAAEDITGLTHLGEQLGFTVRAYHPFLLRGAPISSSRIRSLIAAGEVSQARALLGRPFAITSTPASGRGYGTRYTVPTINLAPYPELVPAHGVYVTTLRIGKGPTALSFRGVTNAGHRPTFGADSYAIESHLFDFQPISLSQETPLELTFLKHLRSEQRFPTSEALRTQIGADVRRAQRYFQLCDALSPVSRLQS